MDASRSLFNCNLPCISSGLARHETGQREGSTAAYQHSLITDFGNQIRLRNERLVMALPLVLHLSLSLQVQHPCRNFSTELLIPGRGIFDNPLKELEGLVYCDV